jgi:hypothetical protein
MQLPPEMIKVGDTEAGMLRHVCIAPRGEGPCEHDGRQRFLYALP